MGYLHTWALMAHALLSDSLYFIAAVIYSSKIPEKWWPGKFDLCNSHTIFHVFIWAAAYEATQALSMLSQLAIEAK